MHLISCIISNDSDVSKSKGLLITSIVMKTCKLEGSIIYLEDHHSS